MKVPKKIQAKTKIKMFRPCKIQIMVILTWLIYVLKEFGNNSKLENYYR